MLKITALVENTSISKEYRSIHGLSLYIETEKHYVVIHTHQESIKCKNRMQEIESMLPDNSFSRCHNAYIVNLDKISHIENSRAYLVNGNNIEQLIIGK